MKKLFGSTSAGKKVMNRLDGRTDAYYAALAELMESGALDDVLKGFLGDLSGIACVISPMPGNPPDASWPDTPKCCKH